MSVEHQRVSSSSSIGVWSKVEQAASTAFTGDGTSAAEQAIYVIEVAASELDVNKYFDCLVVNIADVGGAPQVGCAFYVLWGLAYPSAPESLSSAIID